MNSSDQLQSVIESVGEALAPGRLSATGRPNFSFNGLATPPLRPARKFFGLYSVIEVPPGSWAVCHGGNGTPQILAPGTHWVNNSKSPVSAVQLVDANRRRHELLPVSGLTSDGWRVTIQAVLVYEVVNPAKAARATDVIATLEAAGRAASLAQIEAMSHQALIGSELSPEHEDGSLATAGNWYHGDGATAAQNPNGNQPAVAGMAGLKVVEDGILVRINQRPSLSGLRVVEVAIVERQGDERLVEIIRAAEISRTEVIEERQTESERAKLAKVQLEAQAQRAATARAAALIEAETHAQLANVDEQLKIQAAQTEADIQEIHQIQEAREAERKRLAEEWRTAKQLDLKAMEYQHEETLAIIQGTSQVSAEAAKAGMLDEVEGKLWPQPGNSQVVASGLQVLKGYREQIAPPITRFLPQPVDPNIRQDRLRTESLRLARIRGAEHELVIRHGQLALARVWFGAEAGQALQDLQLNFACSEDYPLAAPTLTVVQGAVVKEYPYTDWDPGLFLADLVQEFMLDFIQVTQNEVSEHEADGIIDSA